MSRPSDPWNLARIEAQAPDEASIKAARKLLKKGGFTAVERRADGSGWWANCQGLTDVYSVTVRREPSGDVRAKCTCPSPKRPCKHALALLIYLAENPTARPDDEAEADQPKASASAFEPLLRAVFASPDDDTPRLVFADLLDESGQPDRAALIRIQCAAAKLQARSPDRKRLDGEVAKLTTALRETFGAVPKQFELDFHRGFVVLTCHGDKPFNNPKVYPERFLNLFRDGWVEKLLFRVTFDTVNPAGVPFWHMVGTLDLTASYVTPNGFQQLAKKLRPHSPDVRLAHIRLSAADQKRVGRGVT